MSKVFTGSKAKLTIGGKEIAFAKDVSFSVEEDPRPIMVVGPPYPTHKHYERCMLDTGVDLDELANTFGIVRGAAADGTLNTDDELRARIKLELVTRGVPTGPPPKSGDLYMDDGTGFVGNDSKGPEDISDPDFMPELKKL